MDLIPNSGPHLHILLNHFPSIGIVITLGLYLTAFYLHSEDLKRSSLVLFFLLGLLAIPTYISGAAARWAIQDRPDIPAAVIFAHQDAAFWAIMALGITGCLAWFALWQERRYSYLPNWNLWAVLILAVVTLACMVRTGNIGGHINHPELELGAELSAYDPAAGITAAIQSTVNAYGWAWPAMEAAHFIGMAFLFGVVLLLSLRVLGMARELPFAALHRLLPLGALGFLVNVGTGLVFFIVDSGRYVAMAGFPLKIAFIMIGGVAIFYFTIFDRPWALRSGEDAPMTAKAMAAATLLSWCAVIMFGRLLPYYGGGG